MKKLLLISVLLNIILGGFYVYHYLDMHRNPLKKLPPLQLKHGEYFLRLVSQYEKIQVDEKDILLLGNSITANIPWNELFEDLEFKNRSISGTGIRSVEDRLDFIDGSDPRKVFVTIGINDLKNYELNVLENMYREMIVKIKEKFSSSKIYAVSLLPVSNKRVHKNPRIDDFNLFLNSLTKEMDLEFVDVSTPFKDSKNQLNDLYSFDGLHLNGNGMVLWSELLEPYFRSQD